MKQPQQEGERAGTPVSSDEVPLSPTDDFPPITADALRRESGRRVLCLLGEKIKRDGWGNPR